MYRKIKYKLTQVSGLPLMQGAVCKVVSTCDKIIIDGQGTTFELKKEKISSITIEKNITKHTQAVSSAGGALAGAMAFGVVGAAIGGRTTAKDIKLKKHYIVITYFDSEYVKDPEKILVRLRDAYIHLEKTGNWESVMVNTQTVYAGYTYGKNSMVDSFSTESSNRGFLA